MTENDRSGGPTHPEGDTGGGRSSRGPATHVPGEAEPGGLAPPYEGRTTSADVGDAGGGAGGDEEAGGVRTGGAVRPEAGADPPTSAPADTPGGRTASPADEQPAADMPETAADDEGVDLTAHVPGTPPGESGGS